MRETGHKRGGGGAKVEGDRIVSQLTKSKVDNKVQRSEIKD